MTQEERLRAVSDCGFTERQARFVLGMRHAGVCIPRQYAGFAGIANGGRRCNAFFDKLVKRGYPKPLMKGVLAHEFLHYVHHTLAVVAAAVGKSLDLTPDDMASWEEYRQGDKAIAADATKWLTPSLRDLAARAEDDGPEIEACHERISANWVKPDLLRLVKLERGFQIDGTMRVDDSLVER